jgi:hypothetical protein
MSRAIGLGTGSFMGARVAGIAGTPSLTYVQAHVKSGKNINARCIIPVYINSNKGTNRDGTPGRSDRFRLVAWGKLADICARSLSKGKALDCVCSPHSYEGRIYDAQGNMRVDNVGQPITVERVGFTIEKIVFGEDSQKEIDLEIQEGRRPVSWNVPNHPDSALWSKMLQDRQNLQFTGGTVFGFARVIVPSGPGITLITNQPIGTPQAAYQAQAPVQTPVGADPNQLVQLIQQVLNSQSATGAQFTAATNPQGYNATPVTQNVPPAIPNQQGYVAPVTKRSNLS